jgi:hypothetical protein
MRISTFTLKYLQNYLSMKKTLLLSITIAALLIMSGCKKTNGPVAPVPDKPTLTGVGTPVGDLVSKTIGKEGGSIISTDGNAELVFPAGALTAPVNISIQPITNTAPNGIGNSYSFLPEGTRFLQPVTLKFHYTAENLASTLADLMGIAFQDSTGAWYRLKNFTNDTVNKVISAPIRHFSRWTPFDMLFINPPAAVLGVGKSMALGVEVVASDDETIKLTAGSDDEVAPLTKTSDKKIVWSANGVVNGNSSFGTLAATSATAVSYHAPAKIPSGSNNPVGVSAKVDVHFTYHGKKFDNTFLIASIRIVDALVYLLEMKKLDSVIQMAPDYMVVWDSVSMKITIKDTAVVISEITNFEPKATPTQLVYAHEAYYYVPDPAGQINITNATGVVGASILISTPGSRLLSLLFTQNGT